MRCIAFALPLHRCAIGLRSSCTAGSLEMRRISAGITGMESRLPGRRARVGLPVAANMLNHDCKIAAEFGNKFGDLVKPFFQGIKARPQCAAIGRRANAGASLAHAAAKNRLKARGLPAQSRRQRFKGTGAPPTLDSVALNFPHYRRRDTRTLRELALTPAKLAEPVTDNPGDRSPVTRHA